MRPLIEASVIPYEASSLRGERLLVLAPHPDDEVIGCGGLVAQHLRERRSVRIVIATDGAQAGDAAGREEESRRGIARLGEGAEVEFLRFPDRALDDAVAARLREELTTFRPDLIAVPSPIEIHPDHLALARAFCDLVQRDELLWGELAAARVAFYEVSQPLRPNTLVDITDVADLKFAGIDEHRSQTALRDYSSFARGLNTYRAMTLPPATAYAEAYYVMSAMTLRSTPFSALRSMTGAPAAIEVAREQTPVSVIIRTKDRPALLREAVDSVRAANHPCEIVVVNDGGARIEIDGVTLVEHETSRGRSVAANEGVRAASHPFIVFLDDDDLHYPEHLPTLTAAATTTHSGWYGDAVSAFLRPSPGGTYETHSRQRLYTQDFDRELLLADNYVPLPTILIRRETFLDLGGFDPEFDLFEDWEFLIRLARRGDFLHVPRVTCEIRHFEGGSSIILATAGSETFHAARLQVWRKHDIQPATVLHAFERQKRRMAALYTDTVEAKGEHGAITHDVARLEREKAQLLARLGEVHQSLNGSILRVRELEGAVTALTAVSAEAIARAEKRALEIVGLQGEIAELRRHNSEAGAALESTRVEIDRLNALLDLIYRSKTWKLHATLEKLRGRG